MSELFPNSGASWAAVVIVLLPLLIIGAGELEERLRQRDSRFGPTIATIRVWVVPLLTLWILARALLDVDDDNLFLRLEASALVLAASVAGLSAFRVVVDGLTDRPRDSGRRPIPRLLLALPRLLLILVTLWVLIAGVWRVDLSAALTALGVTSLVISFALQDTLGGIASGFTLLADQPFSAGDWIESDEIEGRVVDVNWRSTRVQDRNGDLVVIPNGQLATATITNYDRPTRLHRVMVPVQIERTATPTDAKEMLLDAARSTPGVLADPPPFVWVTQIADPVVDYEAYMWIEDFTITPQVKADFGSLVWYLSYRHDVPLPNPAQDLYLFDGTKTAIEAKTTSADIRRCLVAAPLMSELDDGVLDLLAASATLTRYERGETIIVEGDRSDLVLLHEGRARLFARPDGSPDVDILEFDAGEVFGVVDEAPVIDGTVVVVAMTDCEIVTIPPDAAGRVIADSPDLAGVLDQIAATRRRRIRRALGHAARDAVDGEPVETETETETETESGAS